jgi:hypothetical protein
MFKLLCTVPAALFIFAGLARAEEPQAILDKAIAAHGGEEKINKYPLLTWKSKGTVHVMGMDIAFTADYARQYPDKAKTTIDGEIMGQKFNFVQVIRGNKAWQSFAGNVMELEGEMGDEVQFQLYGEGLTRLIPLKDKAYTLAPAGDIMVNDKPAVGVKVSRKNQRDVNLFFDKATGMLVKAQARAKDPAQGMEFDQETFLSDHKDTPAGKRPGKLVIKRDGNVYLEAEYFDFKASEKTDDSQFEQPK